MASNQFLPFSGGPFLEADIALRVMGIHGKKQDAVLRELGVTVVRVAGVEFICQAELNEALAKARAAAIANSEAAK